MSHYSRGSYPKAKRQRANSYDPFRSGVLDREEEDEQEADRDQFQPMNLGDN
jgi:hypothetical protein